MQREQCQNDRLFDIICCYVNRQLFKDGAIDETLYEYAKNKLTDQRVKEKGETCHGSI